MARGDIASTHDELMHRLALVNAHLHARGEDRDALQQERKELMELIISERLGRGRHLVWKPGQPYAA